MFILENNVHSVIKTFLQDTIFLTAVSGGADSIALLSSLAAFENFSGILYALHVDHGLRGEESRGDAEFVRVFCEERKIPCTITSVPHGEVAAYSKSHRSGIEAAARFFRRRALLDEAKRLDTPKKKAIILTAHTKDDVLELSLMRIFRGAGPAGLSGMPVRNGRFVRPLLETTREEVISYLKDKNIPWREDSTNTEDIFLRNKIRHRLIPVLNEFFPSWKKGIGSMAEIQSLAADFIGSEAENRICWETASSSRSSFTTSESNFFNQSLIIREEAVFQGINLLSAQTVSVRGIKRYVVRDFCLGKMTACDLSLARITRKKGKIILAPAKKRVKKTVD